MKDKTSIGLYSIVKSLAFAFVAIFICWHFFFAPVTVYGESMAPTFQDKDRLLVTKQSTIQRFDVVVFDAPDMEGEYYIKRVIGVPGDRIEMKDDVLYINGKKYEEPYLKENKEDHPFDKLTEDFSLQEKTGESTIPEGMYFVLGDNRLMSNDSRFFGLISRESIIGEVKFRFYPFNVFGMPE